MSAVRLSLIYGKNASVSVVDQLVNHTTTLSKGLQMGLVNYTEATSASRSGRSTLRAPPRAPVGGFIYAGARRGLQARSSTTR